MPRENLIGEYLRARRELVLPDEVGVRELGRRRVAGLRRAEVALRAGVSTDYYVRLEQGIEHLRIADASAMPSIVSGNTNAAVLAIAERAASLISGAPVVL